jgi:hypothetical protein
MSWKLDEHVLKPYLEMWMAGRGAQAVREMREVYGIPMSDCKAQLQKAEFRQNLKRAQSLDDLRDAMLTLTDKVDW